MTVYLVTTRSKKGGTCIVTRPSGTTPLKNRRGVKVKAIKLNPPKRDYFNDLKDFLTDEIHLDDTCSTLIALQSITTINSSFTSSIDKAYARDLKKLNMGGF
jgi:hypothetical protein